MKPVTIIRSWRKFIPYMDIEDFEGFSGFIDDDLAKVANSVHGGEYVSSCDIAECIGCDTCEPGFEMLSCDDIVRSVGDEVLDGEVSAALAHLDFLLDYLEDEEDSTLSVMYTCSDIRKEENAAKKQKTLNDHFKI